MCLCATRDRGIDHALCLYLLHHGLVVVVVVVMVVVGGEFVSFWIPSDQLSASHSHFPLSPWRSEPSTCRPQMIRFQHAPHRPIVRRYLTDKLTMDLRSALCPNIESANAEREDAVVVRKVGCVACGCAHVTLWLHT